MNPVMLDFPYKFKLQRAYSEYEMEVMLKVFLEAAVACPSYTQDELIKQLRGKVGICYSYEFKNAIMQDVPVLPKEYHHAVVNENYVLATAAGKVVLRVL